MSLTLVGLIGIGAMVVLLLLGVPIAFAMAVTGAVGIWVGRTVFYFLQQIICAKNLYASEDSSRQKRLRKGTHSSLCAQDDILAK